MTNRPIRRISLCFTFFALGACGASGGGDDGTGVGDPDAAIDGGGGDVSTHADSTGTDTHPSDAPSSETHADAPVDTTPPAPECPCWAGECTSCYCGDAVKAYEGSHGCAVPELSGHEGDLMSCVGGKWSMGTSCAGAGCNVAPDGTPDSCKGTTSATHKLWIAYDSGPSSCKGNTDAFFGCILSRSNFGDMESAWSSGRALAWGGSAVLGSACSFHHGTDATVSTDSTTFQCIEDQTGWDLHTDDVVLYYPTYSGCSDGRNHWHIPVTTKAGASVKVEIGLGFTSNVCTCQTALGMHEVYEASSDAAAADCCNGQTWAPLHSDCGKYGAPSYGWYDLTCGGTTYKAQLISPSTNEYDSSGCTKLTTH